MSGLKRTKAYRLSVIILGLIILVSLDFCFAPLMADVRIPDGYVEPISERYQDDDCTGHDKRSENSEAAKDSGTTKDSDVPVCCLDHDKTTKMDNPQSLRMTNMLFCAIHDDIFYDISEDKTSSKIGSIDLPPPEADTLFSILKKE